jgi:L-fucose isomerase-like protein
VERFLAAVNVADVFRRGARIGHIGQRIDFFWTTIVNESELLDRFNIEIRPIDLVEFIRDVKKLAIRKRAAYRKEIAGWRRRIKVEGQDDATFAHILAVRDRALELAEQHGLDSLALQDFNSLADELGTWCFFANSLISEVMPMACESDIHGAISTLLLHRAQFGRQPINFSEFTIRHPEDDNGVLMWHAGAPLSLCRPKAKPRLGTHWILPNPVPGMTHWPLKDGDLTITRFDGDRGDYVLGVGEGATMPGPETQNNYLWMKVRNWPNWERNLMVGPFIHHVAMTYGHVAPVLREACRFLPGVRLVEFEQPASLVYS